MRQRRIHLVGIPIAGVLAAALMVLTAATAWACPVCMPPSKVTISGPGLSGETTITDATLLQALSPISLPGVENRQTLKESAPAGASYEVVRYFDASTGLPQSYALLGFDHFRYYPGAAGQPGLILYEGPTSGDTQDMAQALGLNALAGKWYAATAQEDAALRAMLGSSPASASSASASPASATVAPRHAPAPAATSATWLATWWPTAALALGFTLLAGALFILRRQRIQVMSSLTAAAREPASVPGESS